MPGLPLFRVDAFTDTPLAGNPCAVVLNADSLSPERMQAVAREMNLSETAFVLRSSRADFRARYFTPAEEIPLAGHPTIATAIALIDSGLLGVSGPSTEFSLELEAGVIQVQVAAGPNLVPIITMDQLRPGFMRSYPHEAVAPVFGLTPQEILHHVPVQTVSTGTPMLMVPLRSMDSLRRSRPDLGEFRRIRRDGDFFSAHLFCLDGVTEAGDTSARHFSVPPEALEDPFTGSATGCMGAYLWKYGLIDEPRFVAEQGHWMNRPGRGEVEVLGPREEIEAVRVGGPGITLFRGILDLGSQGR